MSRQSGCNDDVGRTDVAHHLPAVGSLAWKAKTGEYRTIERNILILKQVPVIP